jgi:hypothetical protein
MRRFLASGTRGGFVAFRRVLPGLCQPIVNRQIDARPPRVRVPPRHWDRRRRRRSSRVARAVIARDSSLVLLVDRGRDGPAVPRGAVIDGKCVPRGVGVLLGLELEGMEAVLGAEVEGLAPELLRDGLGAVDLHRAHGVGGAAALGEPEQRGEDEEAEQVEEELVVDLDGAEDVVAAGSGAGGDEPQHAEEPVDGQRGEGHGHEHERGDAQCEMASRSTCGRWR